MRLAALTQVFHHSSQRLHPFHFQGTQVRSLGRAPGVFQRAFQVPSRPAPQSHQDSGCELRDARVRQLDALCHGSRIEDRDSGLKKLVERKVPTTR
jgi:hypothetical protein